MSPSQAVEDAKNKFNEASVHFVQTLASLRTGRANASMLDGIMVDAYGSPMPLNQVATISAPEAQLLQINPFDPANMQAITAAIRANQQLGLNPSDDGRVIRVPVPPLTEERRRELAKQVGEKLEDAMVRMRGVRHEALAAVDKSKKDKMIGEDEARRFEKQVDDLMAEARKSAETAAKTKEQEVMTL